jgi:hypothetical protein
LTRSVEMEPFLDDGHDQAYCVTRVYVIIEEFPRVVQSRIEFAMLRYRTAFIRSLVLVWLATWVLADPLTLLQALTDPQEYSAACSVIRNGPVGTHVTQHHLDVLISSSTEGNPNSSEDPQSDELGFGDRITLWRPDRFRSVVQTVTLPHCFPFYTSAASRAPPSAWL